MTQFIFDSNYYRNKVTNKSIPEFQDDLKIQKEIEKRNMIKVIFPNIVAIELINHLSDKTPASEICFNALNYLLGHTSEISESRRKGIVMPTFHDLLTLYWFNEKSKHFSLNSNIIQLSSHLGSNNDLLVIDKYKTEINEVRDYKDAELKNIIANIENYYLKPLNQNGILEWTIFETNKDLEIEFKQLLKSKFFHKIFGYSLIQLAVNESSINHFEIRIDHINTFLNEFRISIDFFITHIWEKLVIKDLKKQYMFNPKSDPKKRWNSFYDLQLIFAVEFEISRGRNTVLVTEEKRIKEHFVKYGVSENVIDNKTYMKKYLI